VIEFIKKESQLQSIVRLHDVGVHGVPAQYRSYIKSVPSLITNKNQILNGGEVRNWLASLIPPPEITHCSLGGGGACLMTGLENDEGTGDFFSLDSYGQSLQPPMTPELQAKISKKL